MKSIWTLAIAFIVTLAACNVSDEPTIVDQTDCPAPQTFCAELAACHDLNSSFEACGTCGNACAAGEICAEGACELACPSGYVACDGSCVNPLSNASYCGAQESCADAVACADDEVCSAGACALVCPDGTVECDGSCIDPNVDPDFCGAQGNCSGQNVGEACDTNEVCDRGICATGCSGTSVPCDGGCVDGMENARFCGASGSCEGPEAGTMCASGERCAAGSCVVDCAEGRVACGAECIDPASDPNHCGATAPCVDGEVSAGKVCLANETCYAGFCLPNAATFVSPVDSRGTVTFERDATYTIATLIPGAEILYTTDGTEPSTASASTQRAAEVASVGPLADGTRVQFRIAIDGRTSPVEMFIHRTTPDDVAIIIEDVKFDGVGPVARVEAGASLEMSYLLEHYVLDATLSYILIVWSPEFEVLRCESLMLGTGPTQGTAVTDTVVAPGEPGEYTVSFQLVRDGDCNAPPERTTPATQMARVIVR